MYSMYSTLGSRSLRMPLQHAGEVARWQPYYLYRVGQRHGMHCEHELGHSYTCFQSSLIKCISLQNLQVSAGDCCAHAIDADR